MGLVEPSIDGAGFVLTACAARMQSALDLTRIKNNFGLQKKTSSPWFTSY